MVDTVIRLKADDYDEAIAFLDACFKKQQGAGFEQMLPAVYQPTDGDMACNYAVKRDGEIAAIVGLFPYQWQVGDAVLKIAGIGGVSVGPAFRREGLMRLLMDHVLQVILDGDYDVSFLGGQRQRYRYWGWERGGAMAICHISKPCVQHAFGNAPNTITLHQIDDDTPDDVITSIKALHAAQPMHTLRRDDRFRLFLKNWISRTDYATNSDGNVVGYIISHDARDVIAEVVASNDATIEQMIRLTVQDRFENGVELHLPFLNSPLLLKLGHWAEGMSLVSSGNWQVLDWPKTVGAFLSLRHKTQPLPDGAIVLRLTDTNTTFRMAVSDGVSSCTLTDENEDLALSSSQAVRLLFGPWPPLSVGCDLKNAAWLSQVCPLPLWLPATDHV